MISFGNTNEESKKPQSSGNSLQEIPYEERISLLEKSPLFALTLGSKELAHSNFWKWLVELKINDKHPYVELFIEDFYEKRYKFDCITREEGNRDISIHFDNTEGAKCCHVVENKIKSLPTMEQLNKYQEDVEAKHELFSGTLTGLKDTLDDKAPWSFLSYDAIAERINTIKSDNPSDYDAWIEEYCRVVTGISGIVNTNLDAYKNKYIVVAPEELDKIRLADIFLKLAGAWETDYFNIKIKENESDLKSKWGLPTADLSFHNKKTTITIIYKQEDDDNKEIGRLGVQLEGAQFRIYGGSSDGSSDPGILYRSFIDKNWFYEPGDSIREIDGHHTSMRGSGSKKDGTNTGYCKYEKKNEYTHIYQYWNIDNGVDIETNNGVDIETIWKEVKNKLLDAKKIIDDERISFKD